LCDTDHWALIRWDFSLAIANGSSILGRIAPLIIAQRTGPLNVLLVFALISSIMLFLWTRARTKPGILAYDAIYGIMSGQSTATPIRSY